MDYFRISRPGCAFYTHVHSCHQSTDRCFYNVSVLEANTIPSSSVLCEVVGLGIKLTLEYAHIRSEWVQNIEVGEDADVERET